MQNLKDNSQSSFDQPPRTILVEAVSNVGGGGTTFTASLINAMAKARPQYHFQIAVSCDEFIERIEPLENISIHKMRGPNTSFWRLFWRQMILPWQRIARRSDVIVAQFPGLLFSNKPQIMLASNSHYLMNPPIAGSFVQSLKHRLQHYLFRLGYYRVNKVVFLSKQMLSLAVKWTGENPEKNVVIYEGVAPEVFAEARQTAQSMKNTDTPYFIAVGNVMHHKNYETMLNAFAELVKVYKKPIRLKIAGAYKELSDYKNGVGEMPPLVAFAEQLGVAGQVDWLGSVKFGPELFSLLHNSVAFVSASVLEAFPLTAIEAMAAGTVVIVPSTSSYPEVVAEAGLYHDPTNASSLCNQMYYLLENPAVRQEYLELSGELVKFYTWQEAADRCLDLIDTIARK